MSTPQFTRFTVQPAYADLSAAVAWDFNARVAAGKVLIFRSEYAGSPPWVLINGEGTQASVGFFQDDISVLRERDYKQIFYRACLISGNDQIDSPITSFTSWLAPNEIKGVSRIMKNELRAMHTNRRGNISGNGQLVGMFVPLDSGVPCADLDSLTQQQLGPGPTGGPDDCFGTPFKGGFGPQVTTWIVMNQVKTGREGALGVDTAALQTTTVKARMLAFPRPVPRGLLVSLSTNDRYVIGDDIMTYYFKGVIPFAHDVELTKLMVSDPRYRVPIQQLKYPL